MESWLKSKSNCILFYLRCKRFEKDQILVMSETFPDDTGNYTCIVSLGDKSLMRTFEV